MPIKRFPACRRGRLRETRNSANHGERRQCLSSFQHRSATKDEPQGVVAEQTMD
jgi:hypothetical protein